VNRSARRWVVVLAGGEGHRLASVTTDEHGERVPKQFCTFFGDRSMLAWTIERALRIAPAERVLVSLSEKHRALFEPELARYPGVRGVAQAENRGTAAGVLLPILAVAGEDPDALVAVLPSDHHLAAEAVFVESIGRACAHARAWPLRLILLGVTPTEESPDYGWIVPARRREGAVHHVGGFVEKPCLPLARSLMAKGALWNTFVMVGAARTFRQAFARSLPELVARCTDPASASIPIHDCSRDVLEQRVDMLSVLPVPPCGWADIGTPERLQAALEHAREARSTLSRTRSS
jgi:mannose-1-phosphate guanylyltransferase